MAEPDELQRVGKALGRAVCDPAAARGDLVEPLGYVAVLAAQRFGFLRVAEYHCALREQGLLHRRQILEPVGLGVVRARLVDFADQPHYTELCRFAVVRREVVDVVQKSAHAEAHDYAIRVVKLGSVNLAPERTYTADN